MTARSIVMPKRCTRWRSSLVCSTWRQHSCPGSDLRSSWLRADTTSRPASPALRTFSMRWPRPAIWTRPISLLLQRECPSWLYPVTMGATTIWERWDSMLPDGTINPGQMTSFNHYALGAVADWLHRSIGGITPLQPGYSRVLIAPQPGGNIHWARSSLETRHGKISVSWSRDDDGPIELDIAVPQGVTALVRLPGTRPQEFRRRSTPCLINSGVTCDR